MGLRRIPKSDKAPQQKYRIMNQKDSSILFKLAAGCDTLTVDDLENCDRLLKSKKGLEYFNRATDELQFCDQVISALPDDYQTSISPTQGSRQITLKQGAEEIVCRRYSPLQVCLLILAAALYWFHLGSKPSLDEINISQAPSSSEDAKSAHQTPILIRPSYELVASSGLPPAYLEVVENYNILFVEVGQSIEIIASNTKSAVEEVTLIPNRGNRPIRPGDVALIPRNGNEDGYLPPFIRKNSHKFFPQTWSYLTKSGDTLSAISRKFEIPLEDIVSANQLDDPHLLPVGNTLHIPISARRVPTWAKSLIPEITTTTTYKNSLGGFSYQKPFGDTITMSDHDSSKR